MKFVLTFLLILLFGIPTLPAQEGDAGVEPKARGRQAWFVTTGIPDDLENPVRILTGKKTMELTLSKRMSSGPVKIPGDGIIRMVRELAGPDASSPPTYQTLAEARIPDGVDKALVILVPAVKSGSAQVFRTKVQDLANFKGGDSLYLNLTTVDVAAKLGDKSIALKPGKTSVFSPPGLSKSISVPVSYHYFHPVHKKWKLLSASTIVMRPTRREICIFSWDDRYQRVNYHGVTFPVDL